jgi:cell division protein FtsB
MNVDLGIWDKLTRVILFLIVLAVLLGVVVCYWPLLQRNERMRKVVLQLDRQIQQEEAIERQGRTAIEALRNDPRTVERLAREKLGYAKPGETVLRFEEAVPGSPSAR